MTGDRNAALSRVLLPMAYVFYGEYCAGRLRPQTATVPSCIYRVRNSIYKSVVTRESMSHCRTRLKGRLDVSGARAAHVGRTLSRGP